MGITKPPIILSKDKSAQLSRNDFSPTRTNNTLAGLSSFKTVSMVGGGAAPYRSVSIFQTASRMGIPVYTESDSHLIELTDAQEKVLNIIFEHFSHIDDATKKRVIKAQYIVDIFAGLVLPMAIDRKDVDISAKRIKSNMNSHLAFDQFVGVLEDISLRQLGFESFGAFVEMKLLKYA
jgi:hypothetical protein